MPDRTLEEPFPGLAPASDAAAAAAVRDWREEPPAFYIDGSWPKSIQPAFFDIDELPGTKILQDNYEAIRAEIIAHYGRRPEDFRPNFTPYAYREEGWRTVNLFSYFLEYPEAQRLFPVVDRVVRSIPGMCMAQIAVLTPRTRIKAHFGDTNSIIRSHLGIVVPGGLPELGIRVQREDRTWKEGEIFAISIAHRHFAWNDTDHHRIVLVVDVIRPDLDDRRYDIAAKALATIAMKFCATKFPRLKRLPKPLVQMIHKVASAAFRGRLWTQRTIGF